MPSNQNKPNKNIIVRILIAGSVGFVLLLMRFLPVAAESNTCDPMGWFPTEFGLKDHSVFWYDGYYYLVSITVPADQSFAYARSVDFCEWEDLSPILDQPYGEWDNLAIWAPYVFEDGAAFYMFYTGVKGPSTQMTQSIMLATSTNPADPDSWQQLGMIFQPDHDGALWEDGQWADCRDPMVVRVEDTYYMYYTGRDQDGGIIGLATASVANGPVGPWKDWGSILTLANPSIPESSTVFRHDGLFYLFYNNQIEYFRIGATPGGPWSEAYPFFPGWAHEIWLGQNGQTYASYPTNYSVTISPVNWDNFYSPEHPFIGTEVFHMMLPVLVR